MALTRDAGAGWRALHGAARKSGPLVRLVRRLRMRYGHLDWRPARDRGPGPAPAVPPNTGRHPRILIATSTGGLLDAASVESLVAAALTLRGAAVDVLLCDGALPACLLCNYGSELTPSRLIGRGPAYCTSCHEPARRMYEGLNLTVRSYSQYLSADRLATASRLATETPADRLADARHEGLGVGEQALAGALRYFRRGALGEGPEVEGVLRRFFEAALRTAFAVGALLDEQSYDCVVFHHGVYVPQGVIGEVCRARGVRVVNWSFAYRSSRYIFSHHDTYHRTMMSEPVASWQQLTIGPARREALHGYLRSRWTGRQDWISFHPSPQFDVPAFWRRQGLDDRPTLGLLTSVMWDARLHYPSNAFPDMLAWIEHTIRHVAGRTDVQLLIRVHPAEVRGASSALQRVTDEIARRFPTLPPHIVVVRPEDPISTYALMERCDTALIYNTKTGIELSAAGMPVVVAGEAWIRGKGFATDVSSPEDYERVLAALPSGARLDPIKREMAERYAYHFFFRRMIPVSLLRATGRTPPFEPTFSSWQDLGVGRDRGLDVICDGILHGREFVYPEEAED